jgi:uncharacterized membrane protein (UPF0127 family)
MRAVLVASDRELAARVKVADSFLLRLRGLLGAASLPHGEGLWLIPCKGVHTFGMRFPIDVVFLDSEQRVVAAVSRLLPYRVTPVYRLAASVLELPAGTLAGMPLQIGEKIAIA